MRHRRHLAAMGLGFASAVWAAWEGLGAAACGRAAAPSSRPLAASPQADTPPLP